MTDIMNTVLPVLPEIHALCEERWHGQGTESSTPVSNANSEPLGLSMEQTREVLYRHSPNTDYITWVRDMQAVHHETCGSDEGLNLVVEWSQSDPAADCASRELIEEKWRSFGRNTGPSITMRSLIAEANKKGAELSFSIVSSADDFEDIGEQERARQAVAREEVEFLVANGGLVYEQEELVEKLRQKIEAAGYSPTELTVLVESLPDTIPDEVRRIFEVVPVEFATGQVEVISRKLTEDNLALAFADQHQDKLRYCHTRGSWFAWDVLGKETEDQPRHEVVHVVAALGPAPIRVVLQ